MDKFTPEQMDRDANEMQLCIHDRTVLATRLYSGRESPVYIKYCAESRDRMWAMRRKYTHAGCNHTVIFDHSDEGMVFYKCRLCIRSWSDARDLPATSTIINPHIDQV